MERIGRWIRNGVHILEFARPFSGVYERVKYSSDLPLPKQFPNHAFLRKLLFVFFLNLLKVILGYITYYIKQGLGRVDHV